MSQEIAVIPSAVDMFVGDTGEFFITDKMMSELNPYVWKEMEHILLEEAFARGLEVNMEADWRRNGWLIRWRPDRGSPGLYRVLR